MEIGKGTKIIIAVAVVLILILYPVIEFNGFFTDGGKTEITVENGESFNHIVSKLKDNNVIGSDFLFKAYARAFYGKQLTVIPAGKIVFNGKVSYKKAMDIILNENRADYVTVTIPEGYELREIADLLEKKGLIDRDKFYDAVKNYDFDCKYIKNIEKRDNRLEGFLFPDTYVFSKENDTEITIIQTMLNRFSEIYQKYEGKLSGYTDYEIITLASIIEREAMYKEDFYNVSSVFHNRLKRKDYLSYLQSCATVQYILKERKSVLSVSDTKIDSPYNTYKYKGLPKGPVSSPGELAIDAAVNPNKNGYLYFLNDSDGKLHFSNTFEEHEALRKKYVN